MLDRHGELYIPSADALRRAESAVLGVADAVLLAATEANGATLLTVDRPLWGAALKAKLLAANFDDLLSMSR